MPDPSTHVRAPEGAIAWTPTDGWLYDVADLPTRVEDGHYVLVVSERDGLVRISGTETAPLAAVLRIDADVTELVLSLHDIVEHAQQALARRAGDAS
jgi:hypothetical protein